MSRSASLNLGPVLYQPTARSRAVCQSKIWLSIVLELRSVWSSVTAEASRLAANDLTIHFLEHLEHALEITVV